MAHVKKTHSGLWAPESTHEKVDSQKMFLDNIEQHEMNYVDLIKRVHTKVDSITELKNIDVKSTDSIVASGTLILVDGIGIYYYTLVRPDDEPDDEEIVKPSNGSGWWVLAGGGGNIIVSEEDYGEDTDGDGIILKIKKLFNKKLKTNFFPLTTSKAVRDTKRNKALDGILDDIDTNIEEISRSMIIDEDESGDVGVEFRDADTLGGRYTAEDLDAMPKSTAIEDYANVEPPMVDADSLGGKYTANDIDNIKQDINGLNNSLGIEVHEHDSTKRYFNGDMVLHDGKLYTTKASVLQNPVPITGQFSLSLWEEVNAIDIIKKLHYGSEISSGIRVDYSDYEIIGSPDSVNSALSKLFDKTKELNSNLKQLVKSKDISISTDQDGDSSLHLDANQVLISIIPKRTNTTYWFAIQGANSSNLPMIKAVNGELQIIKDSTLYATIYYIDL